MILPDNYVCPTTFRSRVKGIITRWRRNSPQARSSNKKILEYIEEESSSYTGLIDLIKTLAKTNAGDVDVYHWRNMMLSQIQAAYGLLRKEANRGRK